MRLLPIYLIVEYFNIADAASLIIEMLPAALTEIMELGKLLLHVHIHFRRSCKLVNITGAF
jgi:hypothetical protein